MADEYVQFSLEQGRRIARVVRHAERTEDRSGRRSAEAPERRIPNVLFAVLVSIDGGSAGTGASNCSFTYEVKTLSGRALGAGMTPDRRRFPNTAYTSTPDDTVGQAYFDDTGTFCLFDANELPGTENC